MVVNIVIVFRLENYFRCYFWIRWIKWIIQSKIKAKIKFDAVQRQLANVIETLYQSYSFNFQVTRRLSSADKTHSLIWFAILRIRNAQSKNVKVWLKKRIRSFYRDIFYTNLLNWFGCLWWELKLNIISFQLYWIFIQWNFEFSNVKCIVESNAYNF